MGIGYKGDESQAQHGPPQKSPNLTNTVSKSPKDVKNEGSSQ
jgi:hypothetical protein